jgi:hypothetical protein
MSEHQRYRVKMWSTRGATPGSSHLVGSLKVSGFSRASVAQAATFRHSRSSPITGTALVTPNSGESQFPC